jgi:Uma2 family endonuclease
VTVKEFWELCNRPENSERRLELIRGEVVEWPVPYHKHGAVCAAVGALLVSYAQRARRGYPVAANEGIILPQEPQSVVGPDVAYFTHATADEIFATGWNVSLPLLAVEVLAPNEDSGLVAVKVEEYIRNGVEVVWLIDYEQKTVSVFRPGHEPVVLDRASKLVGEGGLAGLSVCVDDLFRLPGERSASFWQPPA